jgi:hypothetical protein
MEKELFGKYHRRSHSHRKSKSIPKKENLAETCTDIKYHHSKSKHTLEAHCDKTGKNIKTAKKKDLNHVKDFDLSKCNKALNKETNKCTLDKKNVLTCGKHVHHLNLNDIIRNEKGHLHC